MSWVQEEKGNAIPYFLSALPSGRAGRDTGKADPHTVSRKSLPDTEKSITAARQLLSLGLLVQFSRVKQGILSEPSEATDTRQ
jgi:hypothetical protein